MILLLVSFIAGVLTVLAPCILPLLPVIIGGSLTGEAKDAQKKKVVTIVIALGLSVIAFTLLLKVSSLFIFVPEYVWKLISGGILAVLGLVTVFPGLWEGQWLAKLSIRSNKLLGAGNKKNNFWGDVLMGVALGPVFSTCSPTYFIILATVLPVSPIIGIVYLLTYVTGLCLSLFIIAFIGQKIMKGLNVAANPRGWFKRSLGVLFLLVGISIIFGLDKKLETSIISADIFDVTKVEQKLLELTPPTPTAGPLLESVNNPNSVDNNVVPDGTATNSTDTTTMKNETTNLSMPADNKTTKMIIKDANAVTNNSLDHAAMIAEKSKKYTLAPEISTPDGFINTNGQPITLKSLRGKVVLLDIWTYSCINCQRTLPYINDWYAKYKDQGLEVVGLHTPEFAFEKVQSNVEEAVNKFGIKYPVVLDNDYSTWNALGNRFWPRKYLIDEDGYIIYDHIGEGGYDVTEKAIVDALAKRNANLGKDMTAVTSAQPKDVIVFDQGKVASPETYFGASRNEYLGNGTAKQAGEQTFVLPTTEDSNKLYLGGVWNMQNEFAETKGEATVNFKYNSKNVYFVAGSASGVSVDIYKDGTFVKTISVKDQQLYTLIEGTDYSAHTLELKIKGAGLQAFTFTFG